MRQVSSHGPARAANGQLRSPVAATPPPATGWRIFIELKNPPPRFKKRFSSWGGWFPLGRTTGPGTSGPTPQRWQQPLRGHPAESRGSAIHDGAQTVPHDVDASARAKPSHADGHGEVEDTHRLLRVRDPVALQFDLLAKALVLGFHCGDFVLT